MTQLAYEYPCRPCVFFSRDGKSKKWCCSLTGRLIEEYDQNCPCVNRKEKTKENTDGKGKSNRLQRV